MIKNKEEFAELQINNYLRDIKNAIDNLKNQILYNKENEV